MFKTPGAGKRMKEDKEKAVSETPASTSLANQAVFDALQDIDKQGELDKKRRKVGGDEDVSEMEVEKPALDAQSKDSLQKASEIALAQSETAEHAADVMEEEVKVEEDSLNALKEAFEQEGAPGEKDEGDVLADVLEKEGELAVEETLKQKKEKIAARDEADKEAKRLADQLLKVKKELSSRNESDRRAEMEGESLLAGRLRQQENEKEQLQRDLEKSEKENINNEKEASIARERANLSDQFRQRQQRETQRMQEELQTIRTKKAVDEAVNESTEALREAKSEAAEMARVFEREQSDNTEFKKRENALSTLTKTYEKKVRKL